MVIHDQALINAYASLGVSVDRIAVFIEIRHRFLARLPPDVRASQPDDDIVWRLVQLRKARKLPINPSEN
jgi:hypothetical protein